MPLNITLELSDEDLKFFTRVLDSVWKNNAKRPERELIDGARRQLKAAQKAKAPAYVRQRLNDIGMLVDMLDDKDWPLEPGDRRRVLAAISYFAVPKDMISDKVPGIGYLDDALMADLVTQELRHDIDGYDEFRAYRETESAVRGKDVDREDWLTARRKQLVGRITRRRERMYERRSRQGLTHPILRYKY